LYLITITLMTTKKSLSLTENAANIIGQRTLNNKGQWSSTVSHMIEAYETLLNDVEVRLSTSDWKILNDVYENKISTKPILPLNLAIDLLGHKNQSCMTQLEQSDKQYAVLVTKLSGLSQIEQLSIMDKLKLFLTKRHTANKI
jgi:hypothetical protein